MVHMKVCTGFTLFENLVLPPSPQCRSVACGLGLVLNWVYGVLMVFSEGL